MSFTIDISDQVALVTGGTRGIGLAIAEQLAVAGAKVVIASRRIETVRDAEKLLKDKGLDVTGKICNVGDADDRKRLIEDTVELYGQLDILVNNAAANPVFGKVEDTEPWAFAKIMSINVEAPFELAKLALPHLKTSKHGNVLNISSIGGISPEAKLGIYSMSKASLNSLTKVLAKEWGRYGVRVNAVCPGLIQTDFSEALWSNEQLVAHMKQATPLGRIGQPSEIGQLSLAIVSGAAGYCTGQLFTADGGYTI
ncbi:MAG: SDR family NAD(P)-dependent oxidoreductase [Saprospiraceae bacterium]